MRNLWMAMVACFALLAVPSFGFAADEPLAWKHELTDSHIEITFTANHELTGVKAVARNERTKRSATFRKRSLQPGENWAVRLQKPDKTTSYRVDLEGVMGDKTFEGYYTFTVGEDAPPDFDARNMRFEGTQNVLQIVPDRAVDKVHVRARGEDGREVANFERKVKGDPRHPIDLAFETTAPVLHVDVTVHTANGANRAYRFTPWAFETESRGLNFATGSAEIHPSDHQKLDKVFGEIQDAVQRVGKYVDLKLYIGGYTDTVGSSSSNDALSRRRAISIAQYMRKKGVRVPVYIQGFGERALAVETGDNVDEPANRRAVFIVRADAPPKDGNFPRDRWEEVKH